MHQLKTKYAIAMVIVGLIFNVWLVAATPAQQPNIVLIISDDAGYVDFGFQGSQVIPTPNLDQLASRGVRFTNAYIQSVCSPSRAILATGQYGGRFGYEQNIPSSSAVIGTTRTIGLDPEQTTVFDRMKGLGYQNLAVGKWHLGLHADNVQGNTLIAPGNRPTQQGVDEFFGLLGGSRPYFIGDQNSQSNRLIIETLDGAGIVQETIVENNFAGQYITDVIGNGTADYISSHYKQGPFFVYSSFTAPHTPMQATIADLATIDILSPGLSGNRRIYAAMQLAMDRAIGNILNRIDDPNNDGNTEDSIAEETLVIFINDNGGDCCDSNTNSSFNGNLKNGKGSIWEGGIRVPMLMAGAGIDPGNKGSEFAPPVHAGDIVATCFAVGGGQIEPDFFDGVNLLPFINGTSAGTPHDIVYIRRPSNLGLACRSGDFKLYHDRNNGFALFNLVSNPGENLSQNLIGQMPELVESLKRQVTDFDVQFVKRRWSSDNLDSDEFRFLEGAFASANWDTLNAWSNLTDDNGDGQSRLRADDGNSSTTLIFRAKNGGDYVATNNLTRANGLEFMANRIRFVTRPEGLNGTRNGVIDGLPVMLAASPKGVQPEIELDSFDDSANFMTFDWQADLLLYDDLTIAGSGNDVYIFSGNISEYRENRSLLKTGTSSVRFQGTNSIGGCIEINQGSLIAASSDALGTANLIVAGDGTLVVEQPFLLSENRILSGDGEVLGDVINSGVVAPGNSKTNGTLNIVGQFVQTNSSTLDIHVGGINSNEFDQLSVTESVNLAGQLSVEVGEILDVGTELQIISGDIVGTFDDVAFAGEGSWTIDYREDGVWIIAQTAKSEVTPVSSIVVTNGQTLSGDVSDLLDADDSALVLASAAPSQSAPFPLEFLATGVLSNTNPGQLNIAIEASANSSNLGFALEAFNVEASEFELIGVADLGIDDQAMTFQFSNPSQFIDQTNNQIVIRLQTNPVGPVMLFPWNVSLDQLVWLSSGQ